MKHKLVVYFIKKGSAEQRSLKLVHKHMRNRYLVIQLQPVFQLLPLYKVQLPGKYARNQQNSQYAVHRSFRLDIECLINSRNVDRTVGTHISG